MVLYKACFEKEDTGYSVYFPGLKGCITEGDSLEEAYKNAQEALGLYLAEFDAENKPYPQQKNTGDLPVIKKDDIVSLVNCNMDNYRTTKAVKKTLTIPYWLNKKAEERKVNFSRTLQDALKHQLGL